MPLCRGIRQLNTIVAMLQLHPARPCIIAGAAPTPIHSELCQCSASSTKNSRQDKLQAAITLTKSINDDKAAARTTTAPHGYMQRHGHTSPDLVLATCLQGKTAKPDMLSAHHTRSPASCSAAAPNQRVALLGEHALPAKTPAPPACKKNASNAPKHQ
jgi:hypothetical protein